MFKNLPVVLLCGDGGSGKDTIAAEFSRRFKLPYNSSTSYIAAQMMWPQVTDGLFCPALRHTKKLTCPYPELEKFNISPGGDFNQFYRERVDHRRFWAIWIDCYNRVSPSKAQLYLDAVMAGNHILTGLRKVCELDAFLSTGVPDITIWIDRPGIHRDPTQEYGPERCDLVLRNDGDVLAIYRRIERIRNFLVGMYWGEQ